MKIVQKSFVSECFHCMYIEDGYRHNLSIKDAILSLFRFHNETMNIWSHLIGFISIIIAAIVICIDLYENSEDTSTDFFAVECYLFCAALCLLLSTVYHWFGCLSEDCHQILLKLDITGVAVLVTGSFIPGVYYGFYCYPEKQKLHLILSAFVFAVGVYAPWIEWKLCGQPVRPYIMASLVAFGLVPFIHWLMVTPAEMRNSLVLGFLMMFFWYTMGFTFFVSRFPESKFPKSIIATQILGSHFLWHVCVLNAVYVWLFFLLKYRSVLLRDGCLAYEHSQCNSYGVCYYTPPDTSEL